MPDDLNFLYRKYIINVLINFKHIWGGVRLNREGGLIQFSKEDGISSP